MLNTAIPAADTGLPDEQEKEFVDVVSRLGPGDQRRVLLLANAYLLEEQGVTGSAPKAVRARLLAVEEVWDGMSLRPERGKARRGELRAEDLSSGLFRDLGIAPEWVLDGDLDALRLAGRAAARRTAA